VARKVNSCLLLPATAISTEVWSSNASAIWQATVRFQIS